MIIFILQETFRVIRKAKLYFLFSVITTAVSVFLIQMTFVSNKIIKETQKNLSGALTVQVFLDDTLNSSQIFNIQAGLKSHSIITEVTFLSKTQAESLFIRQTGEEFRRILDYNPLPSSFILNLNNEMASNSKIDSLIQSIKTTRGVNDVAFETDIFKSIIYYSKQAQIYILVLSVILTLIAFYIVFSMAIVLWQLRAEEIKIMQLVGSSSLLIRAPILINGVLIGILGSCISLAIWSAFFKITLSYFPNMIIQASELNSLPIVTSWTGPLIGLLSAGVAVARMKK